jgi:hypothetical protein
MSRPAATSSPTSAQQQRHPPPGNCRSRMNITAISTALRAPRTCLLSRPAAIVIQRKAVAYGTLLLTAQAKQTHLDFTPTRESSRPKSAPYPPLRLCPDPRSHPPCVRPGSEVRFKLDTPPPWRQPAMRRYWEAPCAPGEPSRPLRRSRK